MKPSLTSYIASGIVIIAPSRADADKLRRAIALLKRRSPRLFFLVTRRLACIAVSSDPGYFNEAFVGAAAWMTQRSLIRHFSVPYLASLLAHEAHHVRQYEQGRTYMGARAETEAYRVQRGLLRRLKETRLLGYLDQQYEDRWWKGEASDDRDHEGLVRIHRALAEGIERSARDGG
ncbi:MAG TPA: hypothetical protein VI306_09875 [Pyrinomonadaceae bacterium]